MEKETTMSLRQLSATGIVAITIIVLLTGATILSFWYAKGRPGSIVIPAGITYLGPSLTTTPQPTSSKGIIPVSADVTWTEQKGKKYPYSFSYPASLSLGVFPNDPFDSVTIFWENTNSSENLFIRVEDLSKIESMKQYINKSKREYARNWGKQYSWTNVASLTDYTNSHGLKGYKTIYNKTSGEISPLNIFLEIPKQKNLIIWVSSRLLTNEVIEKIADSVSWK